MPTHVSPTNTIVLALAYASQWIHSSTANHQYCKDMHTQSLQFSDIDGPATLALGCDGEEKYLICCMSGFTTIEWFMFDNSSQQWHNFDYGGKLQFHERNQTVSVDILNRSDQGMYKCVGHGRREEETLINEVKLVVYACANFNQVPEVLKPRDNVITLQSDVEKNVVIECEAFFGRLNVDNCRKNLNHCRVGWDVRPVKYDSTRREFPDNIDDNSTLRVYTVETKDTDNARVTSTLNLTKVTELDYDVIYTCWSRNLMGFGQEKTVRIKRPAVGSSYMTLPVVSGSLSVFFIISVFVIIYWTCSLNITLYLRERSRTEPTELEVYDIALLAASFDAFGSYVYRELTSSYSSYRSFQVYRYHEDAKEGEDCNNSFFKAVMRARCVVVVLSTDLLENPNCVFCLNNVIPFAHVVFIIHDIDLRTGNRLAMVAEEVKIYLKYRRRHVVWPSMALKVRINPADVEEPRSSFEEAEIQNHKAVRKFWKQVRVSIPIRSRDGIVAEELVPNHSQRSECTVVAPCDLRSSSSTTTSSLSGEERSLIRSPNMRLSQPT